MVALGRSFGGRAGSIFGSLFGGGTEGWSESQDGPALSAQELIDGPLSPDRVNTFIQAVAVEVAAADVDNVAEKIIEVQTDADGDE